MLSFLVLALVGVGLALLLDQVISRQLRWKHNSARLQEQRAQWEKDHYWDAEADTWRKKPMDQSGN